MKHSISAPTAGLLVGLALSWLAGGLPAAFAGEGEHPVARQWKQELLHAISRDLSRPTVHARNLYHLAAAMYDGWAAYDPTASAALVEEQTSADDVAAARAETISYAAYRLLSHRFANSPGADESLAAFDARMASLGYDPGFEDTTGDSPASVGNRIAAVIIDHGMNDGASEADDYANQHYQPANEPMFPLLPGNPDMTHPNRWQPLAGDHFCDQIGNVCFPSEEILPFLSAEWGQVLPFALDDDDLDIHDSEYPGFDWWVYHDPGPPPKLGGPGDQEYKDGFVQVIEYSGYLDPDDGVMIDISPGALGNNTLGTNDGDGHDLNPATGEPYEPNVVPRGDYTRVLAEFWADGPNSETPPGHWFSIMHHAVDHPDFEMRLAGTGPELDALEWYVKAYLTMGGAMHDAAISAWSVKGYHDYVRPISAIRYMADQGQSSEPQAPDYDPEGIPLVPGLIERITEASSAPGERHEHLAEHVGEIALHAWYGFPFEGEERGEDEVPPAKGVEWIRAAEWWPYQPDTFVSPPFAGYVSGHSTFSRAAAEVMTRLTGSRFFPGGLGRFMCAAGECLEFEQGPSVDVELQWATYQDAADQTSISRIYGGIHPPADDIPGRLMGYEIGHDAADHAFELFGDRLFTDDFGD